MKIDEVLKNNLIADVENIVSTELRPQTKKALKRCFEITIGHHYAKVQPIEPQEEPPKYPASWRDFTMTDKIEPRRTAEELKNKIYDKITDDLKGSRLEGLETDDGDKYPLLDFLSSGTTIKEGLLEVHNLVEQIDIDELLKEYAQNQQPEGISVTDEEIQIAAIKRFLGKMASIERASSFIVGAKWMRGKSKQP